MKKRKPSVEEELFIMIYKLIQKKTSEIFRQPVDPVVLPDYYEKIKNPIDISKIVKKMKEKQYQQATAVRKDFKLLIANCRQYNVRMDILRLADKFDKSIDTEWGNFQKQCKKQMLDLEQPLNITPELIKVFQSIEEKYNRKPQMLQNILGELEQPKRQSAELRILPPIPPQLLQNDKQNDQLPPHLAYKPIKYGGLSTSQKTERLHFELETASLSADFQEASKKKLDKYRKILNNKLQWIDQKIFRKCLDQKMFQKMQSVQHLVSYLQNERLINLLQLRNIQMYVKMAAYWIEQYPQILSFTMKNKFVDTCKSIRKAIFRVLRYRKQARTTKIQVDLSEALDNQMQSAQPNTLQLNGMEEHPEDQSKRYDNEIKSFKRMLNKDQSQTIKKWTKITIKYESGEWTVSQFNSDGPKPIKPPRTVGNRNSEPSEEHARFITHRRRMEEKQQDEAFLSTFKANNSVELIDCFKDKLQFDWDEVFMKRIPQQIEFNPQNFIKC